MGHWCWLLVVGTLKPALWAIIYTLSYQPHPPCCQWRELVENRVERAPKAGQRREPFPFLREQLQHPCNIFCCAGSSGATPASACGAGKQPQLPWALIGRGRNISGKTILQDKSYVFLFTVRAPPFCRATYTCAHSSTTFQSPAGCAKDVKTSQDEVTGTFYAEMGQGSQAAGRTTATPDD